ncbi:ALG-2 interacting protein X [Cucumis melo var. makuwa]|uniref:ALG-2 interacting protein X n=2 Tax=Cucumis melo TaxID=3656 RepID=A0A1S3CSV4_CUCME|nr:vacuolar-sorting protein BRO1 [Cucumis melo]KAA0046303.1 ALG-2 interacting protein X [Cucumis melo var. makuwa]
MAGTASSSSAGTSSNIMLAIFEKKTTQIDLYRPLRNFIAFNYSERDAQNLEDDLQTLKEYRSDLERQSDPSPTARRDLLQSYFKALCLVETRFPISPDKDHVNTITFVWYDAFKQKQKASQQNIHLEKAAVLFNLGAVYSQIGLSFDRATVEGRRQASHAFIAAAGAFAFLRDNASTKASIGTSTTVDVSVECVGMLERLMLAQAQECVFENTIAKGSTPGVCAKISRQVGLYYEEALAALNAPPLNQHFDKAWIAHVQLKAALFLAEACYRYSLELHEKENIAEEIARLRSGISALTEAKKSSKGAAAQLLDAINKLEANLNRNLERAVKENDRVYLMRVPNPSTLPPLPAFSMVKSMAMNEVLDASKEKMFACLIPDSSAKALSRYTEMVDDIIRTQAEKLQQASELTRVRLKEMDLPESILALEGNSSLPTDLKEDVEAVQISGGPIGLEAELQQLRDLRRVNSEMLVQIEELLQKEAREDSQFRSQFGTRWTRPQSSTLTKNIQDRLNRFAGNLKQAAESDARIERSVKDHSALLSILDHRPIESALPTLARPIMSLDANEDAILGTLKQSLRQLENLGAQRAGLEDMLKEMKRKDDILPKLMTSTGSYEDLFRKEVSKYDNICEEISRNIEAQEQLLLQIQGQNNEFSVIFNLEDYKASRERCYKQIQAAVAKYREIKENINEGLKFYVTLQDAITNVKQQCSDFVMTRNIQCREMMEDVQRQMAGLSFQDTKNTPGGYNNSYPAVGPHTQRSHSPQSDVRPPQSYYQPPHDQPPVGGYTQPHPQSHPQPHPMYSSPQQPPPSYHSPPVPPPSTSPYPPHPQASQQPSTNHEYGQPAYPGWQGQYYNSHVPQPGSVPRPPYTIPNQYPPHQQGGYYKPQ